MTSEFKVKGLSQLNDVLQQLPENLEKGLMRQALRAGAQEIAAEAKRRVPVNTGRLRDSIRVTVSAKRGKVTAAIRAGGRDTRKRVVRNASGRIKVAYDNAFYAIWVEFGTSAHAIGAKFAKALVLRANRRATAGSAKRWMRGELVIEGVHHPGARPRPFMRPALDVKAQAAVIAAANLMKERLSSKHGLSTSHIEVEAQ